MFVRIVEALEQFKQIKMYKVQFCILTYHHVTKTRNLEMCFE